MTLKARSGSHTQNNAEQTQTLRMKCGDSEIEHIIRRQIERVQGDVQQGECEVG